MKSVRCSGVLLVFNLQVQRNSGWRDILLKSKLQTSWACSWVIVSAKFMSMCISKAIYSNLTTLWTYYWQEYDWMRPSQWGGWGWEGTVPLVPWNKWPFSHVPLKQNLDFLCSLFPKTGFVPLFPSFLDLCSLFPWKYALVPLFPKTPWSASLIVYNPGNAFSEARLSTLVRRANWWKDGFTFSFNVE